MAKRAPQSPSGITSMDISALIKEIEHEYLGHCVVELRIVPTHFGSNFTRLVVVVANYVGTYRTPRNTRAAVQGAFPSNKYKTLNGCMYGLLYDLMGELDKLRATNRGGEDEGTQAQGRLV